MRRLAAAIALVAVSVGLLAAAGGEDSSNDDEYLVRAVFDNGSFIVSDEDVRIAGANVGHVESVDVSLPGERVSDRSGEEEQAGKAVVVLAITDPAYRDFRADASCILRPQSLIGERYVSCRPTMPRAPDSPLPPPLERIPDGERGAGEYLLPLENNARNVDLDLLQNVQREPYADRLRIILNELGIGFAARGDDVAEIVERSDPTLREINRVLAILAGQRRQLTQLAVDSERILGPLSAARTSVSGFIANAGQVAGATAERRAELEQALARFPGFLEELRATMVDFRGFSNAALPVTEELGRAAPSLTSATEKLARFSDASTVALESFGDGAAAAGPKLAAADPIVRLTRRLANTGAAPTLLLQQLLRSTRNTGGFEDLMDLIYNTGGSVNGFDAYGHFLRSSLVPNNCVDYVPGYQTGCDIRFRSGGLNTGRPITDFPGLTPLRARTRDRADRDRDSAAPPQLEAIASPDVRMPESSGDQAPLAEPSPSGSATGDADEPPAPSGDQLGIAIGPGAAADRAEKRALRDLLDFLVGR